MKRNMLIAFVLTAAIVAGSFSAFQNEFVFADENDETFEEPVEEIIPDDADDEPGDETEVEEVIDEDYGFSRVAINDTNFPDSHFRDWVSENCDSDHNSYLSQSEISEVTTIDCSLCDIEILNGINYFTNLRVLDCSGNGITYLNCSQLGISETIEEIDCSFNGNPWNQIVFDISGMPNLKSFNCSNNHLSNIEIHNENIEYLYCDQLFGELESLNLRGCTSLKKLEIMYGAANLNINYCTQLKELSIYSAIDANTGERRICPLSSIDFTGCINIENISIDGCSISSLELNADDVNWFNLHSLTLTNNPNLTSVDASMCDGLETIDICNNPLFSRMLFCDNLSMLKNLSIDGALTSIDLSTAAHLKHLDIGDTQISQIDISNCPELLSLYLGSDYHYIYDGSGNRLPYHVWGEWGFTWICISPDTVILPLKGSRVNMYRLYNPNSGEHFYTANAGERNHLIGLGWNDEGIGWIAPETSNTPVYRLYNPYGGEHHYTMSVAERDMLIRAGWNDEGIGWYSDDAQAVPLYRQYNPNQPANNHNYTTSLSENNWLVSIGWRAEGIGWYGIESDS